MASLEEQETTICFDYYGQVARVYTTRHGVARQIERRLGRKDVFKRLGHGWEASIPLSECRQPYSLVKISENSDLKREFKPFPNGLEG